MKKDIFRGMRQGGDFQVWHKEGKDFVHVANVRAADLKSALFFTLDRIDMKWRDNPNVEALAPEARSTSLGDKIVDPSGTHHLVYAGEGYVGFREIDAHDPAAYARGSNDDRSRDRTR